MGKSDKKIKADCINKLRKQYDAFLEEDRKRRERNEDILAKLDKMRNTVTRYKGNAYVDHRASLNPLTDPPSYSVRRYNDVPAKVDIPVKHIDETYLLDQISKKYILIPKLTPVVTFDHSPRAITQDNNNDNDWKSKYSILDKLKQNEKEEAVKTVDFGEKYELDKNEVFSNELSKYQDDDPIKISKKTYNPEDVKKDFITNELSPSPQILQQDIRKTVSNDYTVNTQNADMETVKQPPVKNVEPKIVNANAGLVNTMKHDESMFTENFETHQPQHEAATTAEALEISAPEYTPPETNIHQQIEPNPYEYIVDDHDRVANSGDHNDSKHETEYTEKSYHKEEGIEHVEVIHNNEVVEQKTKSEPFAGDSDNTQYPIDIINVQEFTPNDDVTLVDGVNINPDGHIINQPYFASSHSVAKEENDIVYQEPLNQEEQIVNEGGYVPSQQYDTMIQDTGNVDTSDIQAFETEQNEMFYSEQSNVQNYEDYNQTQDAYNAEYTGPMEGYDPSTYYEGAQQEAYPVEVNEHEETLQRYDPNYEQQYVTTDADQTQYVEQQQSAQDTLEELEPVNLEYDPGQFDKDKDQQGYVEKVEQQLDKEEGYVQEQLGGNQGVVDESILYQHELPDQTLAQNPESQTIPEN